MNPWLIHAHLDVLKDHREEWSGEPRQDPLLLLLLVLLVVIIIIIITIIIIIAMPGPLLDCNGLSQLRLGFQTDVVLEDIRDARSAAGEAGEWERDHWKPGKGRRALLLAILIFVLVLLVRKKQYFEKEEEEQQQQQKKETSRSSCIKTRFVRREHRHHHQQISTTYSSQSLSLSF